ncbi:hypothetical protein BDV39DRAFT_202527 [Aspergillus sergii]|uniref:Fucose-specific lectin n=1 Tax=Aspergillus sergii TaxID=1034303 RepID=A0A5N6XAS9_9EURO|nr:hypothetical protein BDV39DRAFT_202527 [Aspergillus sergii]
MGLNVADLIDALYAKAYVFPPDECGMYLVSYDDDALCEEHRVKSENINQQFISMDAPESSPAAYLCDENIVRNTVFTLPSSTYSFPRRWLENSPPSSSLSSAGSIVWTRMTLIRYNRIGGCIESSDCHDIFFQDPSGQLQSVTSAGETFFESLPPIPFTSKLGSPIYAAYRNNVLYISYLDPGNHMHCLTRTANGSDWRSRPNIRIDTEVPGAAFGDAEIANFMSLFDENDSVQIMAVPTKGLVFMVNPYGTLAHLGTVTNGQYKPASGAENIYQLAAKIHGTFKPKDK